MYDDMISLDSSLLKAKVGNDIITGTLDTLNSGMYYHPSGNKSAQSMSYDFQKDVLSSFYTEKGMGAICSSKA